MFVLRTVPLKACVPVFKSVCVVGRGGGEMSGLGINSSLVALSDGNQLGDMDVKTASCRSIFKRPRNNEGFRELL